MLRMSMHGVRMFTERDFYRGRHGQESEEGKEDREGSHQEGGKENFKEKEVVVSATERLRLRVATWTQSETSPKDMPLQPFGIAARQGKIRPDLCAGGYCIKVRFFVSAPVGMICSCAKDRCRMAATLCGAVTRAWSTDADAPTIAIHLKPWRERSRTTRAT